MRDLRRTGGAWLATGGRFVLAAATIATIILIQAFPDYPMHVLGGSLTMIVVPVVAGFGAHWRVPARWLYFAGPVALTALTYALAWQAFHATFALADVTPPNAEFVTVRMSVLIFVTFPAVLVGTVAAALHFEQDLRPGAPAAGAVRPPL